jgi:NAD(P)-dependent dehydrogenase (short-subunit alcohol dehydrogenase family)
MDGFDREGGAAYSRLDILVNSAGISGSSVGDPDGLAGWDRIIAVGFSVKAALSSSEAGHAAADQEFPPRPVVGDIGSEEQHAIRNVLRLPGRAVTKLWPPLRIDRHVAPGGPLRRWDYRCAPKAAIQVSVLFVRADHLFRSRRPCSAGVVVGEDATGTRW